MTVSSNPIQANEGSPGLPIGPLVPPAPGRAPERRVFAGTFVSLSPLAPEVQATRLYELSHGRPEVEGLWTYMGYGPFADLTAMTDWMTRCAQSSDPLWLSVLRAEDRSPVGMVSFLNIDPAMRRLELGHIWYAPVVQRSKVNTETIFLMLRHAFEELTCRRVEWKCDALNARSRTAALRLGFSFEGIFRQHLIVKGRNRDTAWFAMLDSDWQAIKANMEQWLYGPGDAASLTALNAPLLRPGPESGA